MTTPADPPETPTIATGEYRYLAEWLVRQNPQAAGAIVGATHEGTRYAEAVNRIAAEAVLAISFGVIARLPARSRDLAKDIGTMHSMAAFGQDPGPGVWAHLHQLVLEHIEGSERIGMEGAGLTALEGLAALTLMDEPTRVRDALDAAVHAWDQEIPGQHAAVMVWATDVVIEHTKRSGEPHVDEPADPFAGAGQAPQLEAEGGDGGP